MATDLNTIILNAIKNESKYGLQIIEDIKQKTNGTVVLKQPSLYSALRRLETKGFVVSHWEDSELGGKRHYYKATPKGVDALNRNIKIQDATEEYVLNSSSSPIDDLPTIGKINVDEKIIDEEDFDEDEKDAGSGINYKTILGDFLVEEKKVEENHQEPTSPKPQKENIKKNDSTYLQELEDLFKPNKEPSKATIKTSANSYSTSTLPKEEVKQLDKKNLDLLENMAKKYNEKHVKQEKEDKPEDVELELLTKISEKKKLDDIRIKRDEGKYLYINNMNFVSGLCIFFASLVVYLTLFLLYTFKGWINFEKYIIFGTVFLLSLVFVLYDMLVFNKQPEKKIGIKFNWAKSFFIRFLVFVLLIVFIFAVNLLVGMESFGAMFKELYFIRWFVPTFFCFRIIIRWVINFILSKNPKYQIYKPKNKKA